MNKKRTEFSICFIKKDHRKAKQDNDQNNSEKVLKEKEEIAKAILNHKEFLLFVFRSVEEITSTPVQTKLVIVTKIKFCERNRSHNLQNFNAF